MLEVAACLTDQVLSVPSVSAQFTGIVVRLETVRQKSAAMKLLYPFRIAHVRFPTAYVFDVSCVYQEYLETVVFQKEEKVEPIDTR